MNAIAFPEKPLQAHILRQNGEQNPQSHNYFVRKNVLMVSYTYRPQTLRKKIMNAIAFPEMPLQALILRQIGKKIPRATTTSLGKMFPRFLIENASKC